MPRDAYVAALLPVGLALYAIGEAGNLYHPARLARRRRPKEQATMLRGMSALALAATPTTAEALAAVPETPKQSAYSVPQGGLFDVGAMPHYFFELCAWLGVALVAQQLNALLVFGGMASYLGGRAVDAAGGASLPLIAAASGLVRGHGGASSSETSQARSPFPLLTRIWSGTARRRLQRSLASCRFPDQMERNRRAMSQAR